MCRNGAWAMRMDGELGTVEPGRRAVLLVVDGDPLTDIRILNDRTRLAAVISRGRPVDLDRPWPEHGPIRGWKVGDWAAELLTHERAYG
jgi:cytosine/adenosine deaminase-related metal-dependent hydrolase